jgi:iron(III) transport system substrate-binding protein
MIGVIPFLSLVLLVASSWAQEKGWEADWNQLVAAAKKEGTVVVNGSPDPSVRRELPAKFSARFGIPVEYLIGRSGETAARLRTERRAGLYTIDVFISGIDTLSTIVYPEKMLDPIRPILLLPEVLDISKWKKGKVYFADPEDTYVARLFYYVTEMFSIHTRYVKVDDMKSIKELLNPKWKGKIATLDPTIGGSGLGSSSYLYHFGEDFIKRLYIDQKTVISRNQQQVTDWLARGTYPIAFGARESEIEKFRQEGFPLISFYSLPDAPGRLASGFGNVGLMSKAPHPNAARLFVNWLLSREGMETYSRAYGAATTRNDIDESFLARESVPRPGVKYFFDSADWEYAVSGKEKIRLRVKELLNR